MVIAEVNTGKPASERAVRLACPSCRSALREGGDTLTCTGCGQSYPRRAGIPVFAQGSEFYEDYALEHIPYSLNPPPWKRALLRALPYWSWREWKFFRRHLPPGLSILDLGCGRGKEWFAQGSACIAGVDPCWTALVECAKHYDIAAQADMTDLPFPDAVFDRALTSHVFGHIPAEQKDVALAEIARVLKPGGKSLNIIETDSTHRFARYGKQDPDLYQQNFIETDGHIGLELPSAVLDRFRRHGFEIEDVRKMESGITHLRYYGKFLSKGYAQRDPRVRRRMALWRRIQHNPALLAAYEVGMGTYHHYIEPRVTPLDNAMFIMVAAVKRGS